LLCRRYRHEHTRVRGGLAAALALAVARAGFTVAQFTAQVRAMTGQTPEDDSTRQGAYDVRKLRRNQLVTKPGRTRRYHVPGDAARTITAHSPSATRSSPPSSPESGHHDEAAHPTADQYRPLLRNPPPRHADPVQPPRRLYQDSRHIDNILWIAPRQASRRFAGLVQHGAVAALGLGLVRGWCRQRPAHRGASACTCQEDASDADGGMNPAGTDGV
jgi:hypothetical protein